VILPEGQGAISPEGEVLSSDDISEQRADGVTVITTSYGDFLLLPNGMILTPSGTLVDVPAQRRELPRPPRTTVEGG